MAALLIDRGAKVDNATWSGKTPLFAAAVVCLTGKFNWHCAVFLTEGFIIISIAAPPCVARSHELRHELRDIEIGRIITKLWRHC